MKTLDAINSTEQPNNLNSFNNEEKIDIGMSNYEQKLHNENIFIYLISLNNRSKVSVSKRVGIER